MDKSYHFKRTHMIRSTFFITSILLILLPSLVFSADPRLGQPSLDEEWQSLRTDHFNIHYGKRHAALAQRIAVIAERVHARLTKDLAWTPAQPTEVVINDNVDFSNGFAGPIPYNFIYLFPTAPVEGELMSHNEWLELLFTHEYTHTLHLDQATGFPALVRKVFGRTTGFIFPIFTFPQAWSPAWIAEGNSIKQESHSGYGRGNSPIYDAIMRQELIKGLADLSEESYEGYYGSRWPFGQVYLYGSYFFDFLEETYGHEKTLYYINNYNDNWIPWRLNNRALTALGINTTQLWGNFRQYLKARLSPQVVQIMERGVVTGELVEETPYYNRFITPAADGSLIYYHHDAKSKPEIRRIDKQGNIEKLKKLHGVTLLRNHPKHGLLIGKRSVCENTRIFTDLYRLELSSGSMERLTQCQRVLRAAWNPADGSILAVLGGDGRNRLARIGTDGKIESLGEEPTGDLIGDISVSADGRVLAASVKRHENGWNLELYDIQKQKWELLTANEDLEFAPHFGDDATSLYFISTHGGFVNARRLDLDTRYTETLTNSLGYVAEYAPDGQGGAWLVEYTGSGEQIRHMSHPQALGTPYLPYEDGLIQVKNLVSVDEPLPDVAKETESYSSLNTLKPTGWSPLLSYASNQADFLGVQISGRDVLGFHEWFALPGYYFHDSLQEPGGLLFYDFYNRLSLLASHQVSIEEEGDDDGDDALLYDIETRLQLLVHYPFNHLDWNLDLAGGAALEHIEREGPRSRGEQFDNNISGLILSFDNRHSYLHSNGPTDGLLLTLTGERYGELGDSDFRGSAGIASLDGYLDLGANHVFSLNLLHGRGDEGIEPFELHGAIDQLDTLGGFTRLGRREYRLRGYSADAELHGTHIGRAGLMWRFPLARLYDGWLTPPVGLGRIWGNLFAETGAAWDSGEEHEYRTGVGAEFSADLLIGFDNLRVPLTLGYAKGLDRELGESQFYLKLGFTY
jgi:WD40 repeat protein